MRVILSFIMVNIYMILTCNAQVSEITPVTKPVGYQITINAKEVGMVLEYKGLIYAIKQTMQAYRLQDSSLCEKTIITKLDSIEHWITYLLPKVNGLHIDVIGQTHLGGPDDDMNYQIELLESQALIKNILLANQYKIIGDEGNALKVITKNDILSGNDGSKSASSENDDNLKSFYGKYGTLRTGVNTLLLLPDFKSKVIGSEDLQIWKWQLSILGQRIFMPLSELLISLRSYIAFFKVAEDMLSCKETTGVVIIGSRHLRDFIWLARSTGTITDFYFTGKKDFFSTLSIDSN